MYYWRTLYSDTILETHCFFYPNLQQHQASIPYDTLYPMTDPVFLGQPALGPYVLFFAISLSLSRFGHSIC